MDKRKVLFVVNPVSGGISKDRFVRELANAIDKSTLQAEITVTRAAAETMLAAKQAANASFDVVVACGGDGTINCIASQLTDSHTVLGIIPMGSGNGFARALKIPFKLSNALNALQHGDVHQIDTGKVNEHFFINIAGIGFDAHIAGKFHGSKRRGLSTYTNLVINEFSRYQPELYRVQSDERAFERRSFFTAVCNGSQFGNDFTIAPQADVMDGLLELIDVKKPSILQVPKLALNALQRKFDSNALVSSMQGKSFTIEREKVGLVNIDGEPILMGTTLEFRVNSNTLRVVCC
jgi:YegS/Rv2252/BmrU family lipid kinase